MTKAAIYVRISSDPDGSALGVERQRKDCQELAARHGWPVVEVYEDNDVSATRGDRPSYQRMLRDIRGGRIDAVVVWDLDRLHRRPVELEEFVVLAKEYALHLANVGGDVDLSTPQGLLIAGVKAQVGRYESQQISRRVLRKQQELRDAGRPFGGGRRPYGYDKTRNHVVEDEAAVIREVATRLIDGQSLGSIVADLNVRGLRPARAEQWNRTSLRAVMTKPRIAGLLTYKGEILGAASWPPILDGATYDKVKAALDQRRPSRRVANARRYLLSGIAVCGVEDCGLGLQVGHHGEGLLQYRCPSQKHVSRSMRHLDDYIVSELLAHAKENPVAIEGWDDPAQAALRLEVEALERRKVEAAEQFADGSIPADVLRAIANRLQAQIDDLNDKARTSAATAFDGLQWAQFDFDDGWDDMQLHEKRAAISMYVDRLAVHPAKVRGRGFDPASVDIKWRPTERLRFRAVVED